MPDAGLEPILTRAQKRVFSGWALASAALAVGFLSGCLLCSSMFWPSSTSAARTRALSLHVLLGSKLLSVRGLWPLNTMFYADEHLTGQQQAA